MPKSQERLFQMKNLIEQLLCPVNCHSLISALNRGACSIIVILPLFTWFLVSLGLRCLGSKSYRQFHITQIYLREPLPIIPCGYHAIHECSPNPIHFSRFVHSLLCPLLATRWRNSTTHHRGNSSRASEVDGLIRLGRLYSTVYWLVGLSDISGGCPWLPLVLQIDGLSQPETVVSSQINL